MSDEFKPPKSHKIARPFLKKVTLEMSDGETLEFDVDGGNISIDNGIDYNLVDAGILGYELKGNKNQRITIEAFKGNSDYLDTETTPMGTRLFNKER